MEWACPTKTNTVRGVERRGPTVESSTAIDASHYAEGRASNRIRHTRGSHVTHTNIHHSHREVAERQEPAKRGIAPRNPQHWARGWKRYTVAAYLYGALAS